MEQADGQAEHGHGVGLALGVTGLGKAQRQDLAIDALDLQAQVRGLQLAHGKPRVDHQQQVGVLLQVFEDRQHHALYHLPATGPRPDLRSNRQQVAGDGAQGFDVALAQGFEHLLLVTEK